MDALLPPAIRDGLADTHTKFFGDDDGDDGVEKDPATCVKLSLWKADLRGKRMPTVNAWKAFPLLRVVDMRYAPVMICRLKVKVRLHTARDLILIPAHCFALP